MKSEIEVISTTGWRYSLHVHKNVHGTHYDLLLAPPNSIIAYSWSTKTYPLKEKLVQAYRTRDKLFVDLEFEGTFITSNGFNRKKLIRTEIVDIKINNGINIQTTEGLIKIEHVKGKRYWVHMETYKDL